MEDLIAFKVITRTLAKHHMRFLQPNVIGPSSRYLFTFFLRPRNLASICETAHYCWVTRCTTLCKEDGLSRITTSNARFLSIVSPLPVHTRFRFLSLLHHPSPRSLRSTSSCLHLSISWFCYCRRDMESPLNRLRAPAQVLPPRPPLAPQHPCLPADRPVLPLSPRP